MKNWIGRSGSPGNGEQWRTLISINFIADTVWGKELGGEARLFYYNVEGTRGPGEQIIHQLLLEADVPHRYLYEQSASIVGIAVGCQRRFSFWWTQLNEKIVARFSIAFSAI